MKFLNTTILFALVSVAQFSHADALSIKPGDTLQKQIAAQKGKKITVRLLAGEELTGIVRDVSNELLQLGELSGKEYFDAMIDLNKVTAILVKTK